MQVGGTNLLLNSDFLDIWAKESNVGIINNGNYYKITSSAEGHWGIYQDVQVSPNTIYTLSFVAFDGYGAYAIGNGATNVWYGLTGYITIQTNTINSITFTTESTQTSARIYFTALNTNNYIEIYKPKLEKGN